MTTTTAPTVEALAELLHHHYGETLGDEGDRDPGAVWRLVGALLGDLDGLGMLPPGPAGLDLEPGYTVPDTSAPITIRTVADINANQNRIEGLAMRAAAAIAQGLDDHGNPATFAAADVVDLFRHTIAAVLIDQPGTGEAVDIAGEQFGSALRAHLQGVE